MKSDKRGFTLVELMVTVAIMAILTSIVTANFAGSRARARDAKRVSDIVNMQFALDLYFDRCNEYPTLGANNLMDIGASNGCPSGNNMTFGTFMTKIPTGDYKYGVNNPTNPTDYLLMTTLEYPNIATQDDIDGLFPSDINRAYYFGSGSSSSRIQQDCGNAVSGDTVFCVQPR